MTALEPALRAIADAGATARSLREVRERLLDVVRDLVPHDAALLHALSPRVPLETAVTRGVDHARIAATMPSWDQLAVDLGRLRDLANEQLAASDTEAFPAGTAARERFLALASPLGMRSLAVVHLVVRGAVRSVILLGTKRHEAFRPEHLEILRAIAPALAVADALHQGFEGAPRAAAPTALRCEDGRLTARQREIVEHVALGHTNDAIAQALGLSPNTLRNHLAAIFARLGAANRADVVRLAVLTPRA